MHLIRAQRIADAFSQIGGFSVENRTDGVCVQYLGNRAFFFHEVAFWSFVDRLAHASHEEGSVARIETELRA